MRPGNEFISNTVSLAVVGALTAFILYAPPALPLPSPLPKEGTEISLEPSQVDNPDKPVPEAQKTDAQAAAAPEPPHQQPEPPQPAPPPPPEDPKTEGPPTPAAAASDTPKEVSPLVDPEGEVAAREKARVAAAEKEASAFRACLQKNAHYPSSREARKQRPHGTVQVTVSLSGGAITGVEIAKSSGSPILDEAAKASVMSSGCGALGGGSGSVSGAFVY